MNDAEQDTYAALMEGESFDMPSVLHHHGTQWECRELDRINSTRPASRIYFCLPASAYEGKRHVQADAAP